MNRCDLAIHFPFCHERAKARRKTIEAGIVGVSPHIPTDRMLAGSASLPDNLDPELSLLAPLVEDYLLDDKAQDLFALGSRRCRSLPQLRQILAQRNDLRAVGL